MNKKSSSSSKDITRVPVKKLSYKQPNSEKEAQVRAVRSGRTSTSAGIKRKPASKKSSRPPKLPTDYQSDSSIDSSDPSGQTEAIKEKIQTSLNTFKSASSEFCDLTSKFVEDFHHLHIDFTQMKKEVNTVLLESSKSKEDLSRHQNILDSPYKQINLSTKNSPRTVSETLEACFEDPQERLMMLRKQVEDLKEEIKKNEDEIKLNDTENDELRNAAYVIQDTFEDQSENEENTKTAACKPCCLF